MKSGYAGMRLSVILGGLISWIKYIIPVGIFIIGMYLMFNKKENLKGKIIEFLILLLCISTFMSANQFAKGEFTEFKDDISLVAERGYELGIRGIGGGAVGAVVAMPIYNLMGMAGCYILILGIGIITCILFFGIRPIDFIKQRLQEKYDREQQEQEDDEEIEERPTPRRAKSRANKKQDMEEDSEFLPEQLQINIKEPQENKKENNHL